MKERSFSGKIILFGEYTVLSGYRALALPYSKFSGAWKIASAPDTRLTGWAKYLNALAKKEHWLPGNTVQQFEDDLQLNLTFDSNIPTGYGVGSSGALVAAWYDRYIDAGDTLPLHQLRQRLAALENFFHGNSSGLDPMVSLLNVPIMVQALEVTKVPLLNFDLPVHLDLLDTGISRSTDPIVALFQEKKKDQYFREEVLPALGKAQELAIDAYLLSDWRTVGEQMLKISQLQFEHFKEMIPSQLHVSWQAGWEQEIYHKLCGAGGGGFMMRWTNN